MARRKQLPLSILGPKGYTDTTHDRAVNNIRKEQLNKRPEYFVRTYENFRKETWFFVNHRRKEYTVAFVNVYDNGARYVTTSAHYFTDYEQALWFYDLYTGNY